MTVRQLLDSDHEVTVIDSLVSGHLAAVPPDVEFVQADIRDEEALTRLFATHSFDAVINYGGYIQAGESVGHPGRYFANNISGAITLLNTMLTYDVTRLVFSSSAAVYGEPQVIPITEDQPIAPVNPYGETKAAVERLLPWYEKANGLRWVALRYFNAAGAGGHGGEDHRPETHLIPIVLQVALGKRDSVPLYGNDYPTRDGTCVRDYVHVADLASAHLLALDHTASNSGTYNLGSGAGFSNREVVEAARLVTEREIRVTDEPRRPGDPATLVASRDKAERELGWQPAHPGIEDIIASAWDWHRSHPDGYTG
jgi:UDP-glucose 4-epimerase